MSIWFLIAAGIAAATTLLHLWFGRRDVLPSLFGARDLDEEARLTHYQCWHVVTATLIGLGVAFLVAGLWEGQRDLGCFAAFLAVLLVIVNVGTILRFRAPPLVHAQWASFVPMAASGILGAAT